MRTAIFLGHLSEFGIQCLRAILNEQYFNIETIYIADLERWSVFYAKLHKGNINNRNLKRQFKLGNTILKTIPKDIQVINSCNNLKIISKLNQFDLILSLAFPQIFSSDFIKNSINPPLNIHPSFLPKCRGANPIYWTIASGEQYGGISIHEITSKIDCGNIVVREKIHFDPNKITSAELRSQIYHSIPTCFNLLRLFFAQRKTSFPQEEEMATFFTEDLEQDHQIEWHSESISQIKSKIRAGGAFFKYGLITVNFTPPIYSNNFDKNTITSLGTILYISKNTITVKTQDSILTTNYKFKIPFINWYKYFGISKALEYFLILIIRKSSYYSNSNNKYIEKY